MYFLYLYLARVPVLPASRGDVRGVSRKCRKEEESPLLLTCSQVNKRRERTKEQKETKVSLLKVEYCYFRVLVRSVGCPRPSLCFYSVFSSLLFDCVI